MLIFTGIAGALWDSKSDLDQTQARVRLRRSVSNLGQYTATVALSSISNTDSDFIFATNKAQLVHEVGELFLIVDLAVQGDVSVINSFSYHVNAIVDLPEVELKSVLVAAIVDGQPGPFQNSVTLRPGMDWAVKVELTVPAPDPGVFVQLTSSDNQSAPVPKNFVPVATGDVVSDWFKSSLFVPSSQSGQAMFVTIQGALGNRKEAHLIINPLPK
jgi:hypothetical protein